MKTDPVVALACTFIFTLVVFTVVVMFPPPTIEPTSSECRQAKETLVLNKQELILIANRSNQDIITFLERNRWITDSLQQEVITACKPAI